MAVPEPPSSLLLEVLLSVDLILTATDARGESLSIAADVDGGGIMIGDDSVDGIGMNPLRLSPPLPILILILVLRPAVAVALLLVKNKISRFLGFWFFDFLITTSEGQIDRHSVCRRSADDVVHNSLSKYYRQLIIERSN